MIRIATAREVPANAENNKYYVLNSKVTFKKWPVTDVEMLQRIPAMQGNYYWLVYEDKGKVASYTYAGQRKHGNDLCKCKNKFYIYLFFFIFESLKKLYIIPYSLPRFCGTQNRKMKRKICKIYFDILSYPQTEEASVYLLPAFLGKGIGKQLFRILMKWLRDLEIHTVTGTYPSL